MTLKNKKGKFISLEFVLTVSFILLSFFAAWAWNTQDKRITNNEEDIKLKVDIKQYTKDICDIKRMQIRDWNRWAKDSEKLPEVTCEGR